MFVYAYLSPVTFTEPKKEKFKKKVILYSYKQKEEKQFMFENNVKGGNNLMINKKGLSNIIATVLIILLALAAVVIVWSFVRPTIESGGRAVDLSSKCLEAEVEPVSCIWDLNPTRGANIVLKNNKGGISKIVAILEFTNQQTNVTIYTAPPVLSTTNARITFTNFYTPTKLKAAAVVQSDDGTKEQTCSTSAKEVTCVFSPG